MKLAHRKRVSECQRPNNSFMLFAVRFSRKYDKCEMRGRTAPRRPYYIHFLFFFMCNSIFSFMHGVPLHQISMHTQEINTQYMSQEPHMPASTVHWWFVNFVFVFGISIALMCEFIIVIRVAAHFKPTQNCLPHNNKNGTFLRTQTQKYRVFFITLRINTSNS